MNQATTWAEQRDALYALVLTLELSVAVEKYPRGDAVPPVVMIGDPTVTFSNPRIGTVEWPIQFLLTRSAPAGVSAEFDEKIPALLKSLGKGAGIGYVLSRVEPRVVDVQGYPLSGYTIFGTVPLPNC